MHTRLYDFRAGRNVGYVQHWIRPHNAVIRVYDMTGDVIETHKHKGDLKGWQQSSPHRSGLAQFDLRAHGTVMIVFDAEQRVCWNQLVSRYERESIDIHACGGVECRCYSIGRATNQRRSKTD